MLAFKTGGLKDSVFEFNWSTEQGNGVTFEAYNHQDYKNGFDRAINLYRQRDKYEKARINAFNSTMDVADVTNAWLGEFYRLKGKIFIPPNLMEQPLLNMSPWTTKEYTEVKSLEELFGIGKQKTDINDDIDLGAAEEEII